MKVFAAAVVPLAAATIALAAAALAAALRAARERLTCAPRYFRPYPIAVDKRRNTILPDDNMQRCRGGWCGRRGEAAP
eukprot:scaffold120339_cov33-Phaeocystis_antarctica.AAC.1